MKRKIKSIRVKADAFKALPHVCSTCGFSEERTRTPEARVNCVACGPWAHSGWKPKEAKLESVHEHPVPRTRKREAQP